MTSRKMNITHAALLFSRENIGDVLTFCATEIDLSTVHWHAWILVKIELLYCCYIAG